MYAARIAIVSFLLLLIGCTPARPSHLIGTGTALDSVHKGLAAERDSSIKAANTISAIAAEMIYIAAGGGSTGRLEALGNELQQQAGVVRESAGRIDGYARSVNQATTEVREAAKREEKLTAEVDQLKGHAAKLWRFVEMICVIAAGLGVAYGLYKGNFRVSVAVAGGAVATILAIEFTLGLSKAMPIVLVILGVVVIGIGVWLFIRWRKTGSIVEAVRVDPAKKIVDALVKGGIAQVAPGTDPVTVPDPVDVVPIPNYG